jgi:hypothetical protein
MSTQEQQQKPFSFSIGSCLTGQNNWAVWKTLALAYMKRCNFMQVVKEPSGTTTVSFPDEDAALLTMLMNCSDKIKENIVNFTSEKDIWNYLVKEFPKSRNRSV